MNRVGLSLFSILMALVLFSAACGPSSVLSASTPSITQTSSGNTLPKPGKCTSIGQTWTSPKDGVTLVCVPAGEFLMGASNNDPLAADNEKPQHTVYLDAYWIDRTEITNADFAKCLAVGVCQPKVYETTAQSYIPYAVNPAYQEYPAFLYEYDVAADYCQWVGRRIPTGRMGKGRTWNGRATLSLGRFARLLASQLFFVQ